MNIEEEAQAEIREAYVWARDLLIYLDDEVDQSAAATLAVAMLERRDRIMASEEVWECTSTT